MTTKSALLIDYIESRKMLPLEPQHLRESFGIFCDHVPRIGFYRDNDDSSGELLYQDLDGRWFQYSWPPGEYPGLKTREIRLNFLPGCAL